MLGGHRVNRALAQAGRVPERGQARAAAQGGAAGLRWSRRRGRRAHQQPVALQRRVRSGDRERRRLAAALPGRCRHRRHVPLGCADRRLKIVNTDAQLQLHARQRRGPYPGYNIWGADLGITSNPSPIQPTVTFLAFGTSQPTIPMPRTAPYISVQVDQWHPVRHHAHPGLRLAVVRPREPRPVGPALQRAERADRQPVEPRCVRREGRQAPARARPRRHPREQPRHRGVLPAPAGAHGRRARSTGSCATTRSRATATR